MTAELSKHRLAGDALWSSTGVGVSALCAAAYLILVGNRWGAEGLGVFSQALSVYTVVSMFCGFGLHQAALYEVAARRHDPASASRFAWTALTASLALGLLTALLGFAFAPAFARVFDEVSLPAMLRVFALALPLFLINKTTFAILNAHRRMGLLALAEVLRSVTLIVVMCVLAARGAGVDSCPYAFLLAEAVVLVFLAAMCIRVQPPARPSRSCLRPLLAFGSKVALADTVGDLNTRLDVLVIGLFHPASAVGVYTLASAIAKGLWLIPAALQRVTHPLFVQLHGAGQLQKFHRTIDVLLRLGATTFVVLGLAAAVFARPLIGLLYPGRPELLAAISPLYFLLPGAVAYAVITLIGTAPSSSIGRPGNAVRITLLMLGVNLVLNFVLVPGYAAAGASLATTISLLAGFIYTAALLRTQVAYHLPGARYAIVLLAFIMILLLVHHMGDSLSTGLVFAGGASALLAALFALRLASLADMRELLKLLRPAPT